MECHTTFAQPMCSEVVITFQKSLSNFFFLPSTLTRATEKVKRMHRDAALTGEQDSSFRSISYSLKNNSNAFFLTQGNTVVLLGLS
jgi:hypothetical protein